MATLISQGTDHSKLGNFSSLNPRELEDFLSAFAKRFPLSGHVVHAIAQEFGGVLGLADRLEECGLWSDAQSWMTTNKPSAITPENARFLLNDQILDSVARHLSIPIESVEVQASLGIPKFFSTLAGDEAVSEKLGLDRRPKRKPAPTDHSSHP
ncbi:MAG: hypothetical protein H7301_04435 [Cryobacterium sp.]|nr:hypothetical protein [Oligoflexia bacterium]